MEDGLRCSGCMNERTDQIICPYCGYNHEMQPESQIYIKPGTIINNFVFGRVLGHGGFGITYIGYDQVNNRKVAIKEYLPAELATRNSESLQVTIFTGEKAETFRVGIDKFKREAATIRQFADFPGIVDGYEVFEANNTAYFVMEYIEGVTLKDYISQKGGKLPFNTVRVILIPIMDALSEMHRKDIMHRDISPDNIYITQDKQVKLLDFGAARQAIGDHNKSLSVVLKHGFTPKEQYFTKGNQGPWTDVYALGATAYYMLTGKVPQPALDRLEQDKLLPVSSFIYDINPEIDGIFAKVLALDEMNRFQSVDIFKDAITNFNPSARPNLQGQNYGTTEIQSSSVGVPPIVPQMQSQGNVPPVNQQLTPKKKNSGLIAVLIAIPSVVVVAIVIIIFAVVIPKTPDLYKMTAEEAISLLDEEGFDYQLEYDTNEKIDAGDVVEQDPKAKKLAFKKYVTLVVSQGPEELPVPDVLMEAEADAKLELEKFGFDLNTQSVYSLEKEGTVIGVDPAPGTEVKNGSDLSVIVSKGFDPNWISFEDENLEKAIIDQLSLTVDLSKEKISKNMINNQTNLELYDLNINSLKGIEAFEKLERLSCSDNKLTSIANLPLSIQYLDLGYNSIKEADLSRYTNLYSVDLSGNQLVALPKVPVGLESLYLYDNQIVDLTGIVDLTNLYSLDISYNQISDFTPLDAIYSNLSSCYTEGNPGSVEGDSDGLDTATTMTSTYEESNEIPTQFPGDDDAYYEYTNYVLEDILAIEGVVYYGDLDVYNKTFNVYTYEDADVTVDFYVDPSTSQCQFLDVYGQDLPLFGEYDIWCLTDTDWNVIDYFGQPYDYSEDEELTSVFYVTSDLAYCFVCNKNDGIIQFLRVFDKDYFFEE